MEIAPNVEAQYARHGQQDDCEGADFDGSIYDFSKYEESNIIGLTEYKTTTESNGKYEDDDGEPITALLPNQKIYKMKDGSYTWDFRNLL